MKRNFIYIPIVIIIFIFLAGCTEYHSKYQVGDVLSNPAGSCYGMIVVSYHPPTDSYVFQNVSRCNRSMNTSQWEWVGDSPFRIPYQTIDFGPYEKLDHSNSFANIVGTYRTIT